MIGRHNGEVSSVAVSNDFSFVVSGEGYSTTARRSNCEIVLWRF